MNGKIQTRFAMLAALAALAALIVPAGMAAGTHDPLAVGPPTVVHLSMGNQDRVTWEGNTQNIGTRKNNCTFIDANFGNTILVATPTGGQLGEAKDGIGVQGVGDGNGEACARVEGTDEAITLSLGSLLADYRMTAVDLDLELKFNASVKVTYKLAGHPDVVDMFDPMAGSDDGPDSKDGDNYRYYTYRTGSDVPGPIQFDQVVLEAMSGAFSLEGGADLSNADPGVGFGVPDPTQRTSQIEVVKVFDGTISCGDLVTVSDTGVPGVLGDIILHSMFFSSDEETDPDWMIGDLCPLKFYNDDVTTDVLSFLPELADTPGRFTATIIVEDQPITVDSNGNITSLKMTYDPAGGANPSQPLQPCDGQPVFDDPDTTDDDAAYEAFWTSDSFDLIPNFPNETACFYSASVEPTGMGEGKEIWGIVFVDDPSFGFK